MLKTMRKGTLGKTTKEYASTTTIHGMVLNADAASSAAPVVGISAAATAASIIMLSNTGFKAYTPYTP